MRVEIMKRSILALLALMCFSVGIFAQVSMIEKHDLTQAEIDRIIAKFAENEGNFREALKNYVFRRNATMQTIGMGGQISGTFHR